MTYLPNTQIYKYTLVNRIGGGEFGEVWIAEDKTIQLQLAVKLLSQSTPVDERLLEAQIGNKLVHPNVVNIKYADIVNHGDPPIPVVIIAMPFYPKGSVVTQANAANFLDLDKTLRCLIDVLRGLEYLHENGYYHCDIKPQNILVGESGEYLLSDYGISCYSPTHTSVTPRNFYLPHAASENILYSKHDEITDIYQLGLTAFRLINGISTIKEDFLKDRTSFRQSILDGKVITDNSFQPYIPRRLQRIILKASSLNPNDRYQSALEFRRELEKIDLKGGTITSDVHGRPTIIKSGNDYFYKVQKGKNKPLALMTFKENRASGRVTKVTKYCCEVKNQKEVRTAIQRFVSSIL